MKTLLKRIHLNGNTMEFPPQTQKLELAYKALAFTVEEIGLILNVICGFHFFVLPSLKARQFYFSQKWRQAQMHLHLQLAVIN